VFNYRVTIDGNTYQIGENSPGSLYLLEVNQVSSALMGYTSQDCTGAVKIIKNSDSVSAFNQDSLEPQWLSSSVSAYNLNGISLTGKTTRSRGSEPASISSIETVDGCLPYSIASLFHLWNDNTSSLNDFARTQYNNWLGNPPDALIEDLNPDLTVSATLIGACNLQMVVYNHEQYFASLGGLAPNCTPLTANEEMVINALRPYGYEFSNYGQPQDIAFESLSLDSLNVFDFIQVNIPAIDGWKYVTK
jgi:hypothetical protein